MDNTKVGIIGYGVVGRAIANAFEKKYNLVKYDKYVNYDDFSSLSNCDTVFISVPTPFDCENSSVDDSAITEALSNLENINFKGIVIIKSTIPPGSIANYIKKFNLSLVYNPEFLRESTTPNEDFANQTCIVIGTENEEVYKFVKLLYQKVAVSNAEYHKVTPLEAEMIKYAQNTMLASRVALANIIHDACDEHSISYDIIRKLAFDDLELLGPHMVQVPGPDGNKGFGGKCLPKDIMGFSTIHNNEVLNAIIRYNETLRDDLSTVLENFDKQSKQSNND